jgi:molybdenum cofactor cytidylyltransferase
MSTAALVLAAGGSRRMGRPKQLIPWEGRPLLEHVVARVRDWPVSEVIVVLGAFEDEILAGTDLGESPIVLNPEWEEGIASSLRVGLDVLVRDARIERVLITLGDQPEIPAEVPPALLEAQEESRRPVAIPVYRYQRGNPALVERSLWPRLMNLTGDTGASDLFRAHPHWVTEVRFDSLMPRDLDEPGDLERR